ncbi:hypothetical protein HF313_14905 [Massilia atriviolacea]|uniref:Uncharacterized protein n=1 Tax=Massilia atriviolacea TaxID=2495579 RepID=A0A430HR55_9BURK|nr:hypothetical protein [Massilia atriviolacea]RSZ60002.1 hypothetical protein EJB06_07430 [Massilia atriviolacea]
MTIPIQAAIEALTRIKNECIANDGPSDDHGHILASNALAEIAALQAAPAQGSIDTPDERALFEREFPGVSASWNGADYGASRCQRMWTVWQARAHIAQRAASGDEVTGDPLDWPIPCDLVDDAVTLRKGVKLRVVLARLKFLSALARAHGAQTASAPDAPAGDDRKAFAAAFRQVDPSAPQQVLDIAWAGIPGAMWRAARAAAAPAGSWRDKLRWSKANTDYHGMIAFTPAQLEHFVSMLTVEPETNTDDFIGDLQREAREAKLADFVAASKPAEHAEPVAWYADTQLDVNEDSQNGPARYVAHRVLVDGAERPKSKNDWHPLFAAPVAAEPAPTVPAQPATDLRAAVKAAINALADEVNNCDEDAANEKFTAGRCAGIFDLKRALLAQIGGGHE